ncbi:MAG TPA: DUF5671 domain-containing protein [Fimbriimonadaceae bacterium]
MNELIEFVRTALAAGQTRDDIRQALLAADWREDEIANALQHFADVPFLVPVPRRKPFASARDAFVSLVTFGALYAGAGAFGTLLFGLLDHFMPDRIMDRSSYSGIHDDLRWCVATMAVAFPIFFTLTIKNFREYAADPEKRSSKVRHWLTYLTLTGVAFVIMGDFIALVGNVLGGEYTGKFLIQIAIIFFISGSIFTFYFWSMRNLLKGGEK